MRQQRVRLAVNVGNLLELIGAAAAVYGVYRLVGLGFALVLAGVLAIVAAELVYDDHVWRLPLPRRPRPRARIVRARDTLRWQRLRRRARRRARWRARRAGA